MSNRGSFLRNTIQGLARASNRWVMYKHDGILLRTFDISNIVTMQQSKTALRSLPNVDDDRRSMHEMFAAAQTAGAAPNMM
jgi:hypothetical protein